MTVDAHVLDLLSAYALDCLDENERILVSEHLAVCPDCRNELQTYMAVTDQLALATPGNATPPLNVKHQLVDRIHSIPSQIVSSPSPWTSWWQSMKNLLWWQMRPGWSIATIALILLLVAGNLLLWQQLYRSTGTPDLRGMQVISLVNTHASSEANGVLIVSSDGEYGSLVVEHLPSLTSEQRYQLWLIQDNKKIVSGAIFSVDSHGYYATEVHVSDHLDNYSAFSITIEPGEGSTQPTGEEVLTSAGSS